MATTPMIVSSPSLSGGTLPTNACELIRGSEWGIDNVLSSAIIQSEDITCERISDTTQDQKGAVVSMLDYDEHFTLNLTFLCDTAKAPVLTDSNDTIVKAGQNDFSYAGKRWRVNSCSYTGSYAGKKQFSLTAERWHNFPAQN